MRLLPLALGAFFVCGMPHSAFATSTSTTAIDSGDTAWILTATALVLMMTLPGLALFYAGLVQAKNVVSVLMHHFALACLLSVLWVVAGYSLAFSGDGAWVGDLGNLFMTGLGLTMPLAVYPNLYLPPFK